jgi:hypothetical protein
LVVAVVVVVMPVVLVDLEVLVVGLVVLFKKLFIYQQEMYQLSLAQVELAVQMPLTEQWGVPVQSVV